MSLSLYLEQYFKNFQRAYDYQHQAIIASFEIDDLALSVGKFYEKIRKVIDWKEENALRRGAITRALKRNLTAQIYGLGDQDEPVKMQKIAEVMVLELMRSGYFENKLINAEKVALTSDILTKYLKFLRELNHDQTQLSRKDLKQKIKLQNWLLQVASCELEECLAPTYKTTALVTLMIQVLGDRIKLFPKNNPNQAEKSTMLTIAVWRALFEADDYFIAYELIKENKTWQSNLLEAKTAIDQKLNQPEGRQYLRVASKYDAAYRLLGDITEQLAPTTIDQARQCFADQSKIKQLYQEIYQSRYKSLKKRLFKTAFWTTLSILLTNIVSVVLLEWPLAQLAGLNFGLFSIAMDILIPSFAMFLLVILIRLPRPENEEIVWQEIEKIAYHQETNDTYEIRQLSLKRGKAISTFFYLSTLLAGGFGLYGLYLIFKVAGLPWTSIYINIVYITMVLFASLNIRAKAQEITVFEKSNFFDFLLDVFSIPLARIGQWFAKKWKEYNVFSILFSILIDAPLSLFIGFLEDWRNFLKEKKSEIR